MNLLRQVHEDELKILHPNSELGPTLRYVNLNQGPIMGTKKLGSKLLMKSRMVTLTYMIMEIRNK